MCIKVVNVFKVLKYQGKFKTQEIYNKAVRSNPRHLEFIPDHFKTQEMFIKAAKDKPFIPDDLKT